MTLKEIIQQYRFMGGAIPDYMHGGIVRYVENRVEPGGFLRAVLENNLAHAVATADEKNIRALHVYAAFLYNHVPTQCHGSPERVQAWLQRRPVSED